MMNDIFSQVELLKKSEFYTPLSISGKKLSYGEIGQ